MSGFAGVPVCQFCGEPLPPVTMRNTAAGIAPSHICITNTNAAGAYRFPSTSVEQGIVIPLPARWPVI